MKKSSKNDILKSNNDTENAESSDEYLTFYTGEDVNGFFYYDGEERGIKARQNSCYGQWLRSLDADEKEAIQSYAGSLYDDINKYWRHTGDWENISSEIVLEASKKIDKAISRFELRENITVQRGVMNDLVDVLTEQHNVQNSLDELIGKKYVESGYSSTTALFGNPVATAKPTVLEIEIPAGKGHGAYINKPELTGFSDTEYEFLVKRGASFTITSIKKEEFMGQYQYYIKLVMDNE